MLKILSMPPHNSVAVVYVTMALVYFLHYTYMFYSILAILTVILKYTL